MTVNNHSNYISKAIKFMRDADYRFLCLSARGFYNHLSDEEFLKRAYHASLGKELNLDDPQTFNEKLQWLKLHDRKPEYTRMVDKYEVKQYVADIIGEKYIIPTLGVWDSFDEINFDKLPDQFVLKCTHDSGSLVICKDKSKLNIRTTKGKVNKNLKHNYFYFGREWPYKDVKPRIIAEPYLRDESTIELMDYKIHCFHGVPKLILVCRDRFSNDGLVEDFFDIKWNHTDVKRPGQRHCSIPILRPDSLDQMLEISKILSKDMKFLRIDFYNINNQLKIGELTLYPASGFKPFVPKEWDNKMGSWIQL